LIAKKKKLLLWVSRSWNGDTTDVLRQLARMSGKHSFKNKTKSSVFFQPELPESNTKGMKTHTFITLSGLTYKYKVYYSHTAHGITPINVIKVKFLSQALAAARNVFLSSSNSI